MKIAIPLTDGQLSMHFGHCEQFALIETNDATKEIGTTTLLTPPPHEPGLLPRWLHSEGADMIIAGGMGMRAQQLFAQQQIRVVVGAPAEGPETLVGKFLENALVTGKNICAH
ncbi:MAG: ATPase [Lentisphaerae bacterium]|jgi:predicted Fe-Mo cluster-binding NifX family protein|nr:ATPase [Lentisphaerota bacterium]MBT4823542.1 ATPase [Lentisphaerota bacterium]MBT5612704.1 ATPase [Lentisphaerota bacterium]MBT7060335.1 ATPase [Lentisphaerota bacterium]MBT7845603.1 ATPase [Lentisphaerota bacterium]